MTGSQVTELQRTNLHLNSELQKAQAEAAEAVELERESQKRLGETEPRLEERDGKVQQLTQQLADTHMQLGELSRKLWEAEEAQEEALAQVQERERTNKEVQQRLQGMQVRGLSSHHSFGASPTICPCLHVFQGLLLTVSLATLSTLSCCQYVAVANVENACLLSLCSVLQSESVHPRSTKQAIAATIMTAMVLAGYSKKATCFNTSFGTWRPQVIRLAEFADNR